MEKNQGDLVVYCRELTEELLKYREKAKIADKIIRQLKKSGHDSVEYLIKNMAEACM